MEKRDVIISELYRKYRNGLFYYLIKKGYQHDEAHDIVQESFIKAYKKIDSFDNKHSISTWLYRITLNTAIDLYRSSGRNKIFFVGLDERRDELTYINETKNNHNKKVVECLINKLPKKQREVLRLRSMDFTYSEISYHMDITLENVKSLLHRARKELKETINEKYPHLKY